MRFTIDKSQLSASIRKINGALAAIESTLDPGGRAEVITSRRGKLRRERGTKVLHGMAIANILRDKGHDPFDIPANEMALVSGFLESEINDAIAMARDTRRPQSSSVRLALIAASEELAASAVRQIKAGKLGTNATKYATIKRAQAIRGVIPEYPGGIAPYGWRTGRFVEGIRHRFRRGYRPRGSG